MSQCPFCGGHFQEDSHCDSPPPDTCPQALEYLQNPVVTDRVDPPIPSRQYDWQARRESYEPHDPLGCGPTEAAAIADLLEQEELRS